MQHSQAQARPSRPTQITLLPWPCAPQLRSQLAKVLGVLQQARQEWCGHLAAQQAAAGGIGAALLWELQAAKPSPAWQAAVGGAADEGPCAGTATPSAKQLRQLLPEAEALGALLLCCLSLPDEAEGAAREQALVASSRACAYLRCANLGGVMAPHAAGKRNRACSACMVAHCERGAGWDGLGGAGSLLWGLQLWKHRTGCHTASAAPQPMCADCCRECARLDWRAGGHKAACPDLAAMRQQRGADGQPWH